MKNLKTREDFFESLSENEEIDIDIKVDDDAKPVMRSLENFGLKNLEETEFGVIKAKALKKQIDSIKAVDGVEDVEIIKK